jgi:hypothetical protein
LFDFAVEFGPFDVFVRGSFVNEFGGVAAGVVGVSVSIRVAVGGGRVPVRRISGSLRRRR